jgi:hypothetical protein
MDSLLSASPYSFSPLVVAQGRVLLVFFIVDVVVLLLLGSQVPSARSQKAPPPEMRAVVSRVVAAMAAACREVPAHQWTDDRCSCARCSEDEPSII